MEVEDEAFIESLKLLGYHEPKNCYAKAFVYDEGEIRFTNDEPPYCPKCIKRRRKDGRCIVSKKREL